MSQRKYSFITILFNPFFRNYVSIKAIFLLRTVNFRCHLQTLNIVFEMCEVYVCSLIFLPQFLPNLLLWKYFKFHDFFPLFSSNHFFLEKEDFFSQNVHFFRFFKTMFVWISKWKTESFEIYFKTKKINMRKIVLEATIFYLFSLLTFLYFYFLIYCIVYYTKSIKKCIRCKLICTKACHNFIVFLIDFIFYINPFI